MMSKKCKAAASGHLLKLHGTMGLVALACAAAPMASFAAEYTEGMDSIVLMQGSSDGQTNTLAEAIAAYNTANGTEYTISSFNGGDLAAYALVKEGDGTLVMDTAIAGFKGPVVIKDGVLKCMCTEALGADVDGSHVYVRDGATFFVHRVSDSENIFNNNRTLHAIGTGHNGQGALNVDKERKNNSYNPAGIYGKALYLDGNATVVHPSWAVLANPIYLNGYTMIVKSADKFSAGSSYCNATYQAQHVYGPGKMVIDDSIFYLQNNIFHNFAEGSEIEIADNGGFRFWKSGYTGHDWPFHFTGKTVWLFGDNNDGNMRFAQDGDSKKNIIYAARRNRIGSPMILDGATLKMRTQSGIYDNWVFLEGPISGSGDINLECETWADFPAHRLSLLNPANSFTGTATVDKGLLYVYEPGTLPFTVNLVVSRSHALDYRLQKKNVVPEYFGVDFVSAQPQTLSTLTFTSVADKGTNYSGRIQGGCGTFSRIDKQSPNTMEYYSGIGSPLLNVEGGTVKLPRGPAPGLWEGTNKSEIVSDSSNWGAVFTSRMVATNLVARGPLIANFELFPHYAATFNTPITYSGYIWNRYGQDVTVTLVSSMTYYVKLFIDDVPVIEKTSDASHGFDQVFTNITLTTGPHKFEYRTHTGGPCTSNNWDKMLGFAVDPLGRGPSTDTNHFYTVVDPGDGSLFTRSINEADLPHFDEMLFAPGTTLDVNGNAYVASTVAGFPAVTNTATDVLSAPSLTITNRFLVNAADLAGANPPKMTVAMPLSFGDTGGVTVTNLANLTYGHYTIAEVIGEGNAITLTGSTTLRSRCVFDVGNRWAVNLSSDGKTLTLDPQAGMKLFLR